MTPAKAKEAIEPRRSGGDDVPEEVGQLMRQAASAIAELNGRLSIGDNNERARLQEMYWHYRWFQANGWQDAIYAPRGQQVQLIEAGSTGIHNGYRDQDGNFWVHDGETYPANPILWRPMPKGANS